MARARGRQKDKTRAFMLVCGAIVVVFVALPTAILLTVGLLPTLVAFIVDVTRGRYLTKCVAGMNFAGVVPFLYKLLAERHDMQAAMQIVTDAFAWLVMYSAAGMGWLLFLGLPALVSMARVLNAKRRIYVLQERQKKLLAEWGECILPGNDGESATPDQAAARSPGGTSAGASDRPPAQPSPAAS